MSYNYKNGDIITFDLRTVFPNAIIAGQYFEDDNGNVEIYVPETNCVTGFYIKLPKNQKGIDK